MKRLMVVIAGLATLTGCFQEDNPTAVQQTPTQKITNHTGQAIHALIMTECTETQGVGTERTFSDSATIANGDSHTFSLAANTPSFVYVYLVADPDYYWQSTWATPKFGDNFDDTFNYNHFNEIGEGMYVACPTGWQY